MGVNNFNREPSISRCCENYAERGILRWCILCQLELSIEVGNLMFS